MWLNSLFNFSHFSFFFLLTFPPPPLNLLLFFLPLPLLFHLPPGPTYLKNKNLRKVARRMQKPADSVITKPWRNGAPSTHLRRCRPRRPKSLYHRPVCRTGTDNLLLTSSSSNHRSNSPIVSLCGKILVKILATKICAGKWKWSLNCGNLVECLLENFDYNKQWKNQSSWLIEVGHCGSIRMRCDKCAYWFGHNTTARNYSCDVTGKYVTKYVWVPGGT